MLFSRLPRFVLRASGILVFAGALMNVAFAQAQSESEPSASAKSAVPRAAPQIEARLASELLALARPLAGKESELALGSSHAIAVALARLGRTEAALRVAPAPDALYSRDADARDEVWAATARRKLAFGKTAEARAAAARITDPKIRGGVWAAFAFEALQRDRKSEALAFLSQAVKADGASAGRDLRLAVLFARAGQTATAKRIFGRAEAALQRSEDIRSGEFAQTDNLSWNRIMAAEIEAGLSQDVVALVTRTGRHRSDALDTLASAGQFDAARALTNALKSPAERALLQIGFAWALAARGDSAQARELLVATEKEWANATKNAADLRELLLTSALAWYVVGDKTRFERQLARLGEPGELFLTAWEWTPLGSLAPRAQSEAEHLPQWDARFAAFTARALELSAQPTLASAPQATPTLRQLSEQAERIGQAETATALLRALENWMALTPPTSDNQNNATAQQATRLYLATAWRERAQTERAQRWLTHFLSAPDEDFADRAGQAIEAGFVDEGRAFALRFYQPPRQINPYALAPAEAHAFLSGAQAKQSFIEWSRRFPDQRVELLATFARALTQPRIEQSTGEEFAMGKYEFDAQE